MIKRRIGTPKPIPRPIQPGPAVNPSGPRPGLFGNLGEFGPRQYYEQTGKLPPGMNMEQLQPFLTPGTQQPRPINFPPELINPVRPGVQQPVGMGPLPNNFGPMQQQAFSYGGRAGYQMGGIMGLENGQDVFSRLENLNQNLDQVEQTLGTPSNDQFNASSITTAITGRPQMNMGGRMGYQEGGSPEEEMENIKQFYYGRRRGEMEDLLDQYQRFKMRKDFLRRYPRDEARFGGRMGYVKGGITSLDKARQVLQRKAPRGEFLAYINPREAQMLKAYGGAGVDINGTGIPSYFIDSIVEGIVDVGGDILGGIGDIGGDIFGGIGDVLGNLDFAQLAQLYNFAGPMMGLPPIPGMGGPMSFLPANPIQGEGGIGSLLGNLKNFMPQEGGGGGGFNPFEFGANLIMNQTQQGGGPMGGKPIPTDIEIIVNLLSKFLTPQTIAGAGASTIAGLTYEEMKRLNDLREKEFRKYKEDSARKRTQYRTAEGRETLPGYNITGVPQTTADVFNRAPAMRGGIMNVPTGQPRTNSVGVKEIDYRQSGGFVPPIGVKEKADDIPAMLSNNEFVFTADAVRAAGGGSVNKGAQKMYSLMKQLEGKA